MNKICTLCGRPFVDNTKSKSKKYCSNSCKEKQRRIRKKELDKLDPPYNLKRIDKSILRINKKFDRKINEGKSYREYLKFAANKSKYYAQFI